MGRAVLIASLVALSFTTGCNVYSPPRFWSDSNAHAPGDGASPKLTTPNEPTAASGTTALGNSPSNLGSSVGKTPDPKALAEVLAEIQELGDLDHDTQTQLIKDLRNSDPALWPQMAQVFRASLAYRKQLAQRDRKTEETTNSVAVGQPTSGGNDKNTSEKDARQNLKRPAVTKPSDDQIAIAELEHLPISDPLSTNPSDPPDGDYPRTNAPNAPTVEDVMSARVKSPRGKMSPTNELTAQRISNSRMDESDSVSQASYSQRNDGTKVKDWKGNVGLAIQSLEADAGKTTGDEEATRQASLRMLYLIAGRRDEALKPIPGLPSAQQDFWSKELYGVNTLLDSQKNSDVGRRAAEANIHLREASGRLAELAPLQTKNLHFCTEVISFGVFKKFDKYDFKPGQEVLLYAEIDNFVTESTARGFHTALKTSYQILDSRGNRVDEKEFPLTEEYCQNPRRDFFVRYFIYLPKQIYNGQFTLQLSVEDMTGRKFGQSSIEFSVKDKQ